MDDIKLQYPDGPFTSRIVKVTLDKETLNGKKTYYRKDSYLEDSLFSSRVMNTTQAEMIIRDGPTYNGKHKDPSECKPGPLV